MKQLKKENTDISRAVDFLLAHNIWKTVPRAGMERLLCAQGELCSYEKGELVWGGGAEYRRALGLVLEGAAQVQKERLLLSVHRQGDYFGLATLFNPIDRYAADIVALEPCRILFLEKQAIEELLDAHPEAAKQYIAYLSQRVYFLSGRLDAVTAGSAARRLESHLRSMAKPDETGRLVCEIKSYTALAKSLNLGRASLYRALDELAAQQIIERAGQGIVLLL